MRKLIYRLKYPREALVSHLFDRELLSRIFKYLWPYKPLLFLSLSILIVSKITEASIPILIGYLSQKILTQGPLTEGFYDYLLKMAFFIFFLLIMVYILECINVWIRSYVGQNATYSLRKDIYSHIQKLPIPFFDKTPIGKLMTRTIHDLDQIHQMLSESFVPLIGSLFLFVCIFFGVAYINWKVAAIFLALAPFILLFTNNFRVHQRKCYEELRSIIATLNSFVQENLMGISIIRTFGIEKEEKKVFEAVNDDQCTAYLKSVENFGFFIAGIEFFQNLTLILAFIVLVTWSSGGFQAGAFFAFSLYALMIFRPLSDLAERYNVLQAAMAGASRVFAVLDEKVENHGHLNKPLTDIESVVFEDVWFAYEKDNYVLQGLSFTLKKGESLALVGITGSGKTTVINLLLRFYDFQKGSIKINDLDIRDYSLKSLRQVFSVALQDPVLFSGTIRENISLFQNIADKTIEAAAEYVNLSLLLNKLPNGLDASIGGRGLTLSAGEMQLISLARAVAHNRSMVILDEATANIDTSTEKLIQNALNKIMQEKTTLVIAHRLSTIRGASRILVLSQGKNVEMGTHEELIVKGGIYEKLYKLQFG